MIRQDIRIGKYDGSQASEVSYKYIVDLYKAGVDFEEAVTKNYVMIRKYDIINEVIYDTDLYIIERDLVGDSNLAYPITNGSFVGFSSDVKNFNDNLTEKTYGVGKDETYDILSRNDDGSFELADVPCDKIRIYHPHNKSDLDAILYIDSQIRSVHVHLLCRPANAYESDAEADFESEHIRYSEFIEAYIPNLEYLLSGKAYYNEHISMVDLASYEEYIIPASNILTNSNIPKKDDMPISTVGLTYTNSESVDVHADDGTDMYDEPAQFSYHISAEKYSEIKGLQTDDVKVYYIEEAGRVKRIYDERFNHLICSPYNGEADETYAALQTFSLPFRVDIVTDDEGNEMYIKRYMPEEADSVAQDYITWPLRVTIAPYSEVNEMTKMYCNESGLEMNSDLFQEDAKMSLRAEIGFDSNGAPSLVATFDFPSKESFATFRDAYEHYYKVDLNEYEGIVEYDEEDFDEDDYVEQKQCGFLLKVCSDMNMTQAIASLHFEIDSPSAQLDDFAFHLDGIFSQWEQLPPMLVMECMFIDKYLGNIIKSNPVVVCEDKFKYLVNETGNPAIRWESSSNLYNKKEEMDRSKINFIDKISCTIRRATDTSEKTPVKGSSRVLYKPVFYRTQDLQSITLRSGLTQNIGINLSEYMTKVDTFKLTIGGLNIVEKARNDIYVIFSIPASAIPTNSGSYHISNQDDEYISSGNYSILL